MKLLSVWPAAKHGSRKVKSHFLSDIKLQKEHIIFMISGLYPIFRDINNSNFQYCWNWKKQNPAMVEVEKNLTVGNTSVCVCWGGWKHRHPGWITWFAMINGLRHSQQHQNWPKFPRKIGQNPNEGPVGPRHTRKWHHLHGNCLAVDNTGVERRSLGA